MDYIAKLTSVSKSFKGISVLRDVTLSIPRKTICGIQGANGSGKSVLFKLICNLIPEDSGDIWLAPDLLAKGDKYPVGVGAIIDRPGYLPGLTGLDNLLDLARIRNVVGRGDVIAAMNRVGLDPDIRQRVRNYSLGMKQKLAIAQAFMENQQLLLLDEAFNGLDSASVKTVHSLLRDLKDEGRTIVLTSHQQSDIDELCDCVWRINDGTLEAV